MKNEISITHAPLTPVKIALIAGGIFIVGAAFFVGAVFANARTLETFPSHFYIADVDVSGKTPDAAQAVLEERVFQLRRLGVRVATEKYGNFTLPLQDTVFFDTEETIDSALHAAGKQIFWHKFNDFFGMSSETHVKAVVIATEGAPASLSKAVESWRIALPKPVDAHYEIASVDSEPRVKVIAAVAGETINERALLDDTLEALSEHRAVVNAVIEIAQPEISTAAAESLAPRAGQLAAEITRGRTLSITGKKIPLSSQILMSLLQPHMVDGEPTVQIDAAGLQRIVGTQLSSLERPAVNGAFEYSGKRATTFVPSQKGVGIDWDVTAARIQESLGTTSSTLAVAIKETDPEIPLEKTNDLGINEIIGIGYSDFAGSPKNRRHNIAVGMASLRHVLIAPGEDFSLIKALGAIDASSGYLQELVIKGNKTIPEYGGGLCQIGTTTFRAAMAAGLPITERRNHSYQVRYYFENGLSGTDATIYDPKPDFRFMNDTGHWVLFEPRVKGDSLEFVFWGTSDGRKADRTIPKVLSRTPAPPSQIIETTDLPPGTVKCTEKAHAGASTVFTYTIVYADGTVKKQDFSSYYKPWAEVCLKGVAAPSATAPVVPDATTPLSPDAAGTSGT